MATIVELPRLSDTMEEGVVAEWRIAVGDKVKRGQVIADIETDKATMEFESFDAGVVLELVANPGDVLPIGAPIAVFGKQGEDAKEALAKHGGPSAGKKPEAPRDTAAAPAPALAPAATPEAAPAAAPVPAAPAPVAAIPGADGRIPASPVARKLAREAGLPLSAIAGSGPHGRVVKSDVEAAAKGGVPVAKAAAAVTPSAYSSELDVFGRPYAKRADEPQKLSLMRRTIAKRMVQSQQQVPHFYLTIAVEMDEAARVRKEMNLAVSGTKVSFNDMVILAAALALREHPNVNAFWTDGVGITHYGNIDVGMAVAVDNGLIVPVVRNTEQKTLAAISRETRSLGKRAKDGTLKPEEMTGSTFSVSNLGMFGIEEFSAMVNPGEGAILAVGAVAEQPVVANGELVIRKVMKATLSCDHRVVDGAMGAKYLATFKTILEQPMRLFALG